MTDLIEILVMRAGAFVWGAMIAGLLVALLMTLALALTPSFLGGLVAGVGLSLGVAALLRARAAAARWEQRR